MINNKIIFLSSEGNNFNASLRKENKTPAQKKNIYK